MKCPSILVFDFTAKTLQFLPYISVGCTNNDPRLFPPNPDNVKICATIESEGLVSGETAVLDCYTDAEVQFVVIQHSDAQDRSLALCEVEVFGKRECADVSEHRF
jgi:hypothetical protein